MGNIYREVVSKKKTKSIILIVLFASAMIGLSTFFSGIESVNVKTKSFVKFVCFTVTIFYILYETSRCMIKYKYSIMINKFMIHKISSKNQTNVENIYLNDIVYIGKNSDNKYSGKYHKKRYMCDLLTDEKYCCVYKTDNGYKKFYFQPSEELITRIENMKNRNRQAM